jgi:hypothetical protein
MNMERSSANSGARLDALGPGLGTNRARAGSSRRAPSTNFGSVLRRGRVNSMNRAALGLRWLASRGVSTLWGLLRR